MIQGVFPRRSRFGILLTACILLVVGLTAPAVAAGQDRVRPSVLAGTWDPGSPQDLTGQIKD
ncbi:MAG: hypothetical protein V1742_11330, partial [Pseudomonadota bacterium]